MNHPSGMTLPPGPGRPAWIDQLQLLLRPMPSLRQWSQRYGDPFSLGSKGAQPSVFFGSPEAVRQIMTANPGLYQPRRGPRVLVGLLGRQSIQWRNGADHRKDRRLLAPLFQGERILSSCSEILQICNELTGDWKAGTTFRARDFTQEVTLRVIFDLVLGSHDTVGVLKLKHELIRSVALVNHRLLTVIFLLLPPWSLPWLSPWNRLVKVRKRLEEAIGEEVKLHLEKKLTSADDTVLGTLLQDLDPSDPEQSQRRLVDRVITLLFAGHETTASALAWALALIYANPGVLSQLRKELEVESARAPEGLLNLPYLTAVCHEVLRLYPGPLETPRVLQQSLVVEGHILPAGTRLVPCMQLTHRREDIYQDPLSFRPERFLEKTFSPYEFWPFGEGPRKCLGMSLALIEMKLVIAQVIRSLD
ncbi:cytochrome P450 [Synechococcus sp. CCY9202]|uniref:cytochrome P450 n=1 Tax=Synechococcus sp. CCY9202 TaxID=174698 RepID=UPI002B21B6D2|nr:cytochrome P450 [Synechococcus sp. CCY9202]MEA5423863.1 cytochrome P450 [Synechococcus sp. CCY9202]